MNSKTQVLTPSASGEVIYEIIKASIPSLLSPKMTASWEKGLTAIVDGAVSKEEFKSKLNTYVTNEVEKIKTGSVMTEIKDQIKELKKIYKEIGDDVPRTQNSPETSFKCPKCGKDILKLNWGYACVDSKDKICDFTIGYNFIGAKLTDKQIEQILKGERTKQITFKKKDGKTFDASLYFDTNEKQIKFFFENKK